MNRKLIRTTLAEIKERESQQRDAPNTGGIIVSGGDGGTTVVRTSSSGGGGAHSSPRERGGQGGGGANQNSQTGAHGRHQQQRRVPAADTNAETFYYKKQMDAHTTMVIVLQDGEEIEGTIEWYDRAALKINRRNAPNILLLKHNIKYMYKAEDRESGDTTESFS